MIVFKLHGFKFFFQFDFEQCKVRLISQVSLKLVPFFDRKGKERIDKEATHKRIVLKGPVCGIIRIKPWWQALMHKWCCPVSYTHLTLPTKA